MLILRCPCCGITAEETEFHGGGEAHIKRHAAASSDAAFATYMFERKNPKGVVFERWRHVYGCGKWFHAARCAATLEIFGTYSAQTVRPPKKIITAIKARRPDWEETK